MSPWKRSFCTRLSAFAEQAREIALPSGRFSQALHREDLHLCPESGPTYQLCPVATAISAPGLSGVMSRSPVAAPPPFFAAGSVRRARRLLQLRDALLRFGARRGAAARRFQIGKANLLGASGARHCQAVAPAELRSALLPAVSRWLPGATGRKPFIPAPRPGGGIPCATSGMNMLVTIHGKFLPQACALTSVALGFPLPEWALGLDVLEKRVRTTGIKATGDLFFDGPGQVPPSGKSWVLHTRRVPNVPLEDMFAVLSNGEEEVRDLQTKLAPPWAARRAGPRTARGACPSKHLSPSA